MNAGQSSDSRSRRKREAHAEPRRTRSTKNLHCISPRSPRLRVKFLLDAQSFAARGSAGASPSRTVFRASWSQRNVETSPLRRVAEQSLEQADLAAVDELVLRRPRHSAQFRCKRAMRRVRRRRQGLLVVTQHFFQRLGVNAIERRANL